jgi:hypothetical protein
VESILVHIRYSYEHGEITREEAIGAVYRQAIGCWPQDPLRLVEMAMYVYERAPKPRANNDGRPPLYPGWVKNVAADLVQYFKLHQPLERLTPAISNRDTTDTSSPIIRRTCELLEILQLFGDAPMPAPRTLDKWVRERKKGPTKSRLKMGRPRLVVES